MSIPPPFDHQTITTKFILANKTVLITSDPGTGKTRSVLDAFTALLSTAEANRMLVLAPKSIMEASWINDIKQFTPGLNAVAAFAGAKREKAFASNAHVVITNHDAIKWILKNPKYMKTFDFVCIDESTAFKNPTSARSKAARKLLEGIPYQVTMTGTPTPNGVCDIWHQMLLTDGGQRLGTRFYSFRSHVCTPQFNGFCNIWVDRPDAEAQVAAAIHDVNIRYTLDQCLTIPKSFISNKTVTLPPAVRKQYDTLAEDSVLYTGQETINAVHAGAKVNKLLQLCTGAVYAEDSSHAGIHADRYELVLDLVEQRKDPCLVAFNWSHEREYLVEHAKKRGLKYAVIDGSISSKDRLSAVERMEAGQLDVMFCHPQSAGHGLTLVRAKTAVWASPTYNAEFYTQFNARIRRAGQKHKTEIIHIAAHDTFEPLVYEKLQDKTVKMNDLLGLLHATTNTTR